MTDGARARHRTSGDTHLFCEWRSQPRSRGRGARGRALPTATQARSPGTARARLPRAGPPLQESGNPGARWLSGEAVSRGDGTRATRGAGLFRAMRCLDFDRRQFLPSLCPAAPVRLRTRAPRTCRFFAGRRLHSPKLQTDCFRRRSLGRKACIVQRQPRAGGRGQAKEWRLGLCAGPKLMLFRLHLFLLLFS